MILQQGLEDYVVVRLLKFLFNEFSFKEKDKLNRIGTVFGNYSEGCKLVAHCVIKILNMNSFR